MTGMTSCALNGRCRGPANHRNSFVQHRRVHAWDDVSELTRSLTTPLPVSTCRPSPKSAESLLGSTLVADSWTTLRQLRPRSQLPARSSLALHTSISRLTKSIPEDS